MRRLIIGIAILIIALSFVGCRAAGGFVRMLETAVMGEEALSVPPTPSAPNGQPDNGEAIEKPVSPLGFSLVTGLVTLFGGTTAGGTIIASVKAYKRGKQRNKDLTTREQMNRAYAGVIQELRNEVPKAKELMTEIVARVVSEAELTLAEYEKQVTKDKAPVTKPKG